MLEEKVVKNLFGLWVEKKFQLFQEWMNFKKMYRQKIYVYKTLCNDIKYYKKELFTRNALAKVEALAYLTPHFYIFLWNMQYFMWLAPPAKLFSLSISQIDMWTYLHARLSYVLLW